MKPEPIKQLEQSIPEFLQILIEAIPENFSKIKWKPSWTLSLLKFYEEQSALGIKDETFMIVSEALASTKKEYINYNYTYRTWFRNELRWTAERAPAPSPSLSSRETKITPITDELRDAWRSGRNG